MKVFNSIVLFLTSCFLSLNALAGNNELVPRKGMGPLDKAKVNEVQAQKWSKIGTMMEMADDEENRATQTSNQVSSSASIGSRSKNCSTNVGNVATKKGLSSGRYGPQGKNNNIVVVKGDVINVCK